MADRRLDPVISLLRGAKFALSVPSPRLLPVDRGCEVAFAGRSNTGKSSAINVLCDHRGLARTSRTPGRTQHLVVFDLDLDRRLVDLPGFGYAKVSKAVRAQWERHLPEYLERRASLTGLILVMDVRHPLKDQEELLVRWCAASGVRVHILLNKCDKISRGKGTSTWLGVGRQLRELGGDASVQLFSAQARTGLDEALTVLDTWLDASVKAPAA